MEVRKLGVGRVDSRERLEGIVHHLQTVVKLAEIKFQDLVLRVPDERFVIDSENFLRLSQVQIEIFKTME
jgi:hypothetical protein